MSHTGEKPYHCNQWEKSFTWNQRLVKHHGIHTGDKSYLCSQYNNCLFPKEKSGKKSMEAYWWESISMQPCDKYFGQQKNLVKYQWIVGYTLRINHIITVNVNYVLEEIKSW